MIPVIREFNSQIQPRFERMIRDLRIEPGGRTGSRRRLSTRWTIEASYDGGGRPDRDAIQAAVSEAVMRAAVREMRDAAPDRPVTQFEREVAGVLLTETLGDLRQSAFAGAYHAAGEQTRIGGWEMQEPTENLDDLMDSGFRKIGPEGFALVSPVLAWWLMGGRNVEDDAPKVGECLSAAWRDRLLVVNRGTWTDAPVLFLKPGWAATGGSVLAGAEPEISADGSEVVIHLITDVAFEIDPDCILSVTVKDLF
jgi:hypothetical protein